MVSHAKSLLSWKGVRICTIATGHALSLAIESLA